MKFQKQPTRLSCFVTAFAILCDMDVHDLIAKIGKTDESLGYNIQEIITALFPKFSITEFADIEVGGQEQTLICGQTLHDRITKLQKRFSGVITIELLKANDHALVWDHDNQTYFDPATGCFLNSPVGTINGFWIAHKIRKGKCV